MSSASNAASATIKYCSPLLTQRSAFTTVSLAITSQPTPAKWLGARTTEGLQIEGVIPQETVVLRGARLLPMVRGYFLLNQAYKGWRIEDGHNTEKPKIAALQAIVIARFQPFLPIKPSEARTVAEARCNEIFALAYAGAILERAFVPDTPEKLDFWMRLLEIIAASSAETLEPYFQDVAMQINRPLEGYTIAISKKDRLAINSLISIFELISAKGIELLK